MQKLAKDLNYVKLKTENFLKMDKSAKFSDFYTLEK